MKNKKNFPFLLILIANIVSLFWTMNLSQESLTSLQNVFPMVLLLCLGFLIPRTVRDKSTNPYSNDKAFANLILSLTTIFAWFDFYPYWICVILVFLSIVFMVVMLGIYIYVYRDTYSTAISQIGEDDTQELEKILGCVFVFCLPLVLIILIKWVIPDSAFVSTFVTFGALISFSVTEIDFTCTNNAMKNSRQLYDKED